MELRFGKLNLGRGGGGERRGGVGSRHGSSFVTAIFDEGDGLKKLLFS